MMFKDKQARQPFSRTAQIAREFKVERLLHSQSAWEERFDMINLEDSEVKNEQEEICKKYKSRISHPNIHGKIGIALESLGTMPITGVRKIQENGTEGWYIWGGEYSDDPDFFKPVHLLHIEEIAPGLIKYLSLSPGFKFIIDNTGYEDVWYDEELLR
jgi:hypothetical protein